MLKDIANWVAQHSRAVSILATGPSCPGFESWMWVFFRKKFLRLVGLFIFSTQWTVKCKIKLIEPIQYWQASTEKDIANFKAS